MKRESVRNSDFLAVKGDDFQGSAVGQARGESNKLNCLWLLVYLREKRNLHPNQAGTDSASAN